MQILNTIALIRRHPETPLLRGLLRHGRYHLMRRAGLEFRVDLGDFEIWAPDAGSGCVPLLNSMGYYDYDNMHFLRAFVRPEDVFVDIGANIGVYTCLVGCAGCGEVVAMEPHPDTAAVLSENVVRNGLNAVRVMEAAVSTVGGRGVLSDEADSTTRQLTSGQGIEVAVVAGQELIQGVHPGPGGLVVVKVDAEGHDGAIVESFGDRITDVDALIIEDWSGVGALPMEGPFWIDWETRRIHRRITRRRPDPVFFSENGAKRMESLLSEGP